MKCLKIITNLCNALPKCASLFVTVSSVMSSLGVALWCSLLVVLYLCGTKGTSNTIFAIRNA